MDTHFSILGWTEEPECHSPWDLKEPDKTEQPSIFSFLLDPRKAREFQNHIYFFFIDYAKTFDFMDFNKLWIILDELGIQGHLTYLLKNLYAGQETIVRTEYGTPNWLEIGKRVYQGCLLSPFLFNFYAEYIIRKAKLDESQAGIEIARKERKVKSLSHV